MIALDISLEEEQILSEMLEDCIADLRAEIMETDRQDYKLMLKRRKEVLLKIREALAHAEYVEA